MATIGYRRASSSDQNLARQELGHCDEIFEEKVSGKSTSNRQALQDMLQYARTGDTVVCYSIDRMARDLRDLQDIVTQLNDKGVVVRFITEGLSFSNDNDDAMAKLQLHMMGAFAEFERSIIRRRQAEGIAKAKERGVYDNTGRKPSIDREQVRQLRADGMSTYKIAEQMNISRMSVHRILKEDA